jgi:hypothetical protein
MTLRKLEDLLDMPEAVSVLRKSEKEWSNSHDRDCTTTCK